ncbi:hypothetical protein GCM10011583_07450 [Streptomyces camponoticapitis]|uniref:Uncharacterized protein n=1 Tax=Streptomyces camponoticapitis TaxID=1616125 RepID=A0ABQ2E0W2_9ACTN|nr:hypothetical protein GCM10011583_07450 [Streptomyces camponoticapitis]
MDFGPFEGNSQVQTNSCYGAYAGRARPRARMAVYAPGGPSDRSALPCDAATVAYARRRADTGREEASHAQSS